MTSLTTKAFAIVLSLVAAYCIAPTIHAQPPVCRTQDGCFDANIGPFNAVADNTSIPNNGARIAAAIKSAVSWSLANGKKKVTVKLDPGKYTIADALSTENGARAQIPLPKVPYTNAGIHLTIESKGESGYSFPGWLSNSDVGASVVLASTLTGQSQTSAGSPFVMGGPDVANGANTQTNSTWLTVHLRGIAFQLPSNPTIGGFNASLVAKVRLEDFRVHAQVPDPTSWPSTYVEPTNPTGIANLMPINGLEGGDYVGIADAAGLYGGLAISELTHASGPLFIYSCKTALNIQAPWYHSAHIGYVLDTRNVYTIASVNPSRGLQTIPGGLPDTHRTEFFIDTLDIEDAVAGWNRRVAHVFDAASTLQGQFRFKRVAQNSGSVSGLIQPEHYARNVKFIDRTRPFYEPNVVYDSFVGSGGLGIKTRLPQVNQGSTWTSVQGFNDFNLQSGGGAQGSPTPYSLQVIETNHADAVVSVNVRFGAQGGSAGLDLRHTDRNNRWSLEWMGNGVANFAEVTNGTVTLRTSGTVQVTPGVVYTVVAVMKGPSISMYINGVKIGSTVNSSSHQAATKHGIVASGNAVQFTDFAVTPN